MKPPMNIYAYLRCSTEEQDPIRARESLLEFAKEKGVRISSWYVEQVSGAKLDRPQLNQLIADSEPGDILLIEKVDRLSRLPYAQWVELRTQLKQAGIRIIVLDQPMTHSILDHGSNEATDMISSVLTEFMIDLAAAMARDEYETRRRRMNQGIAKAKALGKYKGKPRNKDLWHSVGALLKAGNSYSQIERVLGCSRTLISAVKKELKD